MIRTPLFLSCLLLLGVTDCLALNLARVEMRADRATAEFNATGRGVIVAILDRGLDYTHPDFRNPDGTTRIAGIFDLVDDSGASAPGNTFGIGTLYTRAQIDAALASGLALRHRDAVGHGTTTTGLAAGNGARSNGLYRGIAPEATLLIVKVTSDGAVAHDNEPAEAPFFSRARLLTAIDYVRAKAAEFGMPCVMLLNLGSQNGPTDGSSSLARKIDSAVGPGKPGLVFVTGPGDEGGQPNRAAGTVAAGQTQRLEFQKVAGPLRVDLWYPDSDRFDVQLNLPSGNTVFFPSPATNSEVDQRTVAGEYSYFHYGSNRDTYESTSAKRSMVIDFPGAAGTYAITLRGATVTNGRFDATMNPSFAFNASTGNRFTSFVAPGSIWDGATAFNNISPTSYVHRDRWTDINNVVRLFTGEGLPGQIWRGSSTGPTFDGRLGIDVAAPGDRVVTTYGPRTVWATLRFNLVQGGDGFYGMAGAVSAAAPMVTGIIALMLQMNPTLDAAAVKRILQQTARADSFTGTVPNTTWGYGKVDAYAAVARTFSESARAGTRGRLANLSILTGLNEPGDEFTLGYVVGGDGTSGAKPILIRAAGPSLAQLGVSAPVGDPRLELFSGGAKTGENDNWGGTAALANAFSSVGAFGYASASSLDAAVLTSVAAGNNTVRVAANGTGTVIAELYDSTPTAAFAGGTPRLVNVSVLKHIGSGLTAGFVIGGSTGKTVLVRAIGPTIGAAPFNVAGAITDPQLTLFSGTTPITSNDNWGGTPALAAAFSQVGAFALPPASRDAALVATLQPGSYTVQVTGTGNTTGVAIVEVYEVP